jgi:radical SAM protein with 4Fe4S-binding SPASM domain
MMNGDRGILAHRNPAEELLPVLTDAKLHQYLLARGSDPGHAEGRDSGNTYARPIGSATSSGIESDAYDDIPCSAGHNSLYISPYGDVFPCVQLVVPSGNLRRQSFEEIWYGSTEMRRVRAVRENQLPDCANCSLRSYCERCPGLALMEGGDLLGAYERACELAELRARLAGVENPISAFHARVRRSAAVGSHV